MATGHLREIFFNMDQYIFPFIVKWSTNSNDDNFLEKQWKNLKKWEKKFRKAVCTMAMTNKLESGTVITKDNSTTNDSGKGNDNRMTRGSSMARESSMVRDSSMARDSGLVRNSSMVKYSSKERGNSTVEGNGTVEDNGTVEGNSTARGNGTAQPMTKPIPTIPQQCLSPPPIASYNQADQPVTGPSNPWSPNRIHVHHHAATYAELNKDSDEEPTRQKKRNRSESSDKSEESRDQSLETPTNPNQHVAHPTGDLFDIPWNQCLKRTV